METTERDSQENIKRTAPIISRAYQLGKEKRVDEAFESIRPYLQNNEVPANFYQPVGWTVYRFLKKHNAQLPPVEANNIIGYYLNISPHKPDMVHSFIMVQVLAYKKMHASNFSFINFCHAWDLKCFRQEDYLSEKSTTSEGKSVTFQSLAVKVATCLYKELKMERKPEQAREFLPFFEDISAKCPDYAFTPLYIANLYAWCGEAEKAITEFRLMLLKDQQWYVWKHLGDLLEPTLRIACYCKAITMMSKEDYLVDVHLSLAGLLQSDNAPQAAFELQTYMATCHRNGWLLRSEAYSLENSLHGTTISANGSKFYTSHVQAAEDYVFASQSQCEFVYTGLTTNRKGKRCARLVSRDPHLVVAIPITPLIKSATPGDVMKCHYRCEERRVVLLTIHSTGRKENVHLHNSHCPTTQKVGDTQEKKIVEGTVRLKDGQAYAFVDDCFVPPSMRQANGLFQGQHVKLKAVKRADGRWRAVKILD